MAMPHWWQTASGWSVSVNRYLHRQRVKQRLLGHYHTWSDFEGGVLYGSVPRVTCRDGFTVSVQGGIHSYSDPRANFGPWSAVELGFPSDPVTDNVRQYKEDESEPDENTVYAYVPVELVDEMLWLHGGIKEDYMKRLFMIRKKRKGPVVTGPDGEPWYFADKMEAKKVRDSIGSEAVVSLGPDHRRNDDGE